MKKHIIYSMVLLATASMITACSENAWNDHLDGFESGFNYTEKITVSYTLTNNDYETIGKALAKIAVTEEEQAAAKAIQSNHYFDKSSPYPASVAIPYLLDDTSSDYYIYSNGSTAEITFREADSTPAEIGQIATAYTYTVALPTTSDKLPDLLKERYPETKEGQFAIVSYIDANAEAAAVNYSVGKSFSQNPSPIVNTRGSSVWSVSEALAQMGNGFEGEATVIGVISAIQDLSTSYGNATYFIKDNESDETSLEIFRGYYIDGEKFTSEDQLKVGATVVVTGNLVNYNGTFEFTTGSQILNYYPETVWTVSEALSQMSGGFKGEAIVRGVISEIQDLSTSYGNATYFIKDNLNDEVSLEIFRGYYIDGEKFTSEDQLAVGAMVVVSGELTIYNDTYEFNSGSKILNYFFSNDSSDYNNLTDNIKDLEDGSNLTATAVVTAQCTRGLILTDNAGSILYYNTNIDLATYPVGTVVEISGTISSYNHGYQLSNSASIEIKESMDYKYPAPEEYTADMITEATEGTENILATYCSLEGVVTFSGNYTNIEILGTSVQGSVYYIPDELKEKLVSGSNYKFYGYFTSFTSTYFYIVVTDFEEVAPAFDPNSLINEILYYDGSNWEKAENVVVLNPSDYIQMGFSNNNLSDPEIYLPLFLKKAYPYALPGDEIFVAYNIKTNSASSDLLVYDGNNWSLNNNSLEEVTGAFTKTDGKWNFSKYLGKAIYKLFDEEEVIRDRAYLMVSSSSLCANPVLATNSYGYLLTTPVTISGNQIVMANENNSFRFLSSIEVDGNTVKVPDGYFVIKDSYDRYMYLQGTYSSFNVTDSPTLEADGSIGQGFLFSASLNENGSWTINNNRGEGNIRNIYYSSGYSNFAAYTEQGANDSLPFLYLLDEE